VELSGTLPGTLCAGTQRKEAHGRCSTRRSGEKIAGNAGAVRGYGDAVKTIEDKNLMHLHDDEDTAPLYKRSRAPTPFPGLKRLAISAGHMNLDDDTIPLSMVLKRLRITWSSDTLTGQISRCLSIEMFYTMEFGMVEKTLFTCGLLVAMRRKRTLYCIWLINMNLKCGVSASVWMPQRLPKSLRILMMSYRCQKLTFQNIKRYAVLTEAQYIVQQFFSVGLVGSVVWMPYRMAASMLSS
jgi:hypothetical protein